MDIERMVMTVTIPDFMQHNVIAKATFVIQTNQKRYVDCEVSSVRFVVCTKGTDELYGNISELLYDYVGSEEFFEYFQYSMTSFYIHVLIKEF